MTKIRITRGVFGLKKGLTTVPKTPKDEPFDVDEKTAKRLVAKGIAEVVTGKEKKSAAEPKIKYTEALGKANATVVNKNEGGEDEGNTPEGDNEGEGDAENNAQYSDKNTKPELLEILKSTGYEVTSATERLSKPEIIAILDEQFAEGESEDGEDDGEDAPEITGDGVVG